MTNGGCKQLVIATTTSEDINVDYDMTRVNDTVDGFPESEVDMAIWPCIMTACLHVYTHFDLQDL